MSSTQVVVAPGFYDFKEDFTQEALKKGLFHNTCLECKATITGAEHRRTCARCVSVFNKIVTKNRN